MPGASKEQRSGRIFEIFHRKWVRRSLCIILILALAVPYMVWQATGLELNLISYQSDRLPQELNGFKILQVSDLHNNEYGKNQEKLLQMTKKAKPDMIAITGDLIDRNDIDHAVDYVQGAVSIAPVFYVPGNHEAEHPEGYQKLKKELDAMGVVVLEDEAVTLTRGNAKIQVIGMRDPEFYESGDPEDEKEIFAQRLSAAPTGEMFTILLSHRPELMELYRSEKIDLVFSGHVHGGLVRLPFIGAPFAIDQKIFPQYTKGLYQEGDTAMVVSGGAGNGLSSFFRLWNFPELVLTTLYSKPLSVEVETSTAEDQS